MYETRCSEGPVVAADASSKSAEDANVVDAPKEEL